MLVSQIWVVWYTTHDASPDPGDGGSPGDEIHLHCAIGQRHLGHLGHNGSETFLELWSTEIYLLPLRSGSKCWGCHCSHLSWFSIKFSGNKMSKYGSLARVQRVTRHRHRHKLVDNFCAEKSCFTHTKLLIHNIKMYCFDHKIMTNLKNLQTKYQNH